MPAGAGDSLLALSSCPKKPNGAKMMDTSQYPQYIFLKQMRGCCSNQIEPIHPYQKSQTRPAGGVCLTLLWTLGVGVALQPVRGTPLEEA